MIPIPAIPEGYGRLILGFYKFEALDTLIKTFSLDKAEDIEAFVVRQNFGPDMYYILRCECKMAPYDKLGDLLQLMLSKSWRENARFIYRETADGSLIQVKHSGSCDPEETVKTLNALVTLNMPIFKGRMGLPLPIPSEA